jgi:hypothetical protein
MHEVKLTLRENPPDMIRWQRIGEAVEKIMSTSNQMEITHKDGEQSVTVRVGIMHYRGELMKVLTLIGGT